MKSKAGIGRAGPAKVLCADDDGRVLFGIARVLTCAGFAVTTAVDGMEAWTELQCRSFDLLITDYEMPKLNGPGLAIRARLKYLKLPIIVMSGAPRFEAKFDCELFRGVTLVRKPFTPDELLDTIKQVLSATAATTEGIPAGSPAHERSGQQEGKAP